MKKSKNKITKFHNICIAGTSSGDGKTVVTLALLRALKMHGIEVQPFKCGPDYIDGVFHKQSCGKTSINLDSFMMGSDAVKKSFKKHTQNCDVAVTEGVMGLFDSAKVGDLSGSTADVTATINSKIILVVNAKGMANSIAAIVQGYCNLQPNTQIIGVIANKVGSQRHAQILSESLEIYDLPPLLGYLQRDDHLILPERHLGLKPFFENNKSEDWFNYLGEKATECFDINKILQLTESKRPELKQSQNSKLPKILKNIRIAYALDEAFNFYYSDNLALLQELGAELIPFSPINDTDLPENINGIYIGGGFPEEFAKQLSNNSKMLSEIKKFAKNAKNNQQFIYAECGGYMYLTNYIIDKDEKRYNMCGVINTHAIMTNKRRALGYRIAQINIPRINHIIGKDIELRGHEFHWSTIDESNYNNHLFTNIKNSRGNLLENCGYNNNNIFASYIHINIANLVNIFH